MISPAGLRLSWIKWTPMMNHGCGVVRVVVRAHTTVALPGTGSRPQPDGLQNDTLSQIAFIVTVLCSPANVPIFFLTVSDTVFTILNSPNINTISLINLPRPHTLPCAKNKALLVQENHSFKFHLNMAESYQNA